MLGDPHHVAGRAAIYHGAWERRRGSRSLAPMLDGINGPIAGREFSKALKRLDNTQAGGMACTTVKISKLAIYAPDSPFGNSVLGLIHITLTKKCIPKRWYSYTVVAPAGGAAAAAPEAWHGRGLGGVSRHDQ
jgi:hypothetical protein